MIYTEKIHDGASRAIQEVWDQLEYADASTKAGVSRVLQIWITVIDKSKTDSPSARCQQ